MSNANNKQINTEEKIDSYGNDFEVTDIKYSDQSITTLDTAFKKANGVYKTNEKDVKANCGYCSNGYGKNIAYDYYSTKQIK